MTATTYPDTQSRRAAARVPLEEPKGVFGRLLTRYAIRTYGDVPDTALALFHNVPVLRTVMGFEKRLAKWDRLDPHLKELAQIASAASIGCSWCLDFGYYISHSQGRDTSQFRDVPRWREVDVFSPLEQQVMEYAEAVTATPPEVTDEMAEALRSELGDAAFVELTMMVCVENERSRFNSAMGLTSQGFSDRCELPPR